MQKNQTDKVKNFNKNKSLVQRTLLIFCPYLKAGLANMIASGNAIIFVNKQVFFLNYRQFKSVFVVLSWLVYGVNAQAEALQPVQQTQKLIRIRPLQSVNNAFNVQLITEKQHYFPGERIRFMVRGNQTFYLYLFNVDAENGQGIAILPNRLQSQKQIKYPGDNRKYLVPNRQVEFYADRPGTERIIMVASKYYLDIDKLAEQAGLGGDNNFLLLKNTPKVLETAFDETYSTPLMVEKRIRIRGKKTTPPMKNTSILPKGVIIQEFNLTILDR